MKRYVLTLEMYVYAENDASVKAIAESKAKKEREYNDNRCSVVDIVEQPFGQLKARRVS
jgi:hypothetical protein